MQSYSAVFHVRNTVLILTMIPFHLRYYTLSMLLVFLLVNCMHVKTGCPLILLCNLAPACGLCNGTRMVLLCSTDHVLEVKILGGDHHSEIALIPQITLIPSARNGGSSQFNWLSA
jgi:hypothetical protein